MFEILAGIKSTINKLDTENWKKKNEKNECSTQKVKQKSHLTVIMYTKLDCQKEIFEGTLWFAFVELSKHTPFLSEISFACFEALRLWYIRANLSYYMSVVFC